MKLKKDGTLDRRFNENKGKSDPYYGESSSWENSGKGRKKKKGCLKKLGCLGLIFLPILAIFGLNK